MSERWIVCVSDFIKIVAIVLIASVQLLLGVRHYASAFYLFSHSIFVTDL